MKSSSHSGMTLHLNVSGKCPLGNWCSSAINYMLRFLQLFQTKSILQKIFRKLLAEFHSEHITINFSVTILQDFIPRHKKHSPSEYSKAVVKLTVLPSIFPLRTAHMGFAKSRPAAHGPRPTARGPRPTARHGPAVRRPTMARRPTARRGPGGPVLIFHSVF